MFKIELFFNKLAYLALCLAMGLILFYVFKEMFTANNLGDALWMFFINAPLYFVAWAIAVGGYSLIKKHKEA